MRPTCSIQDIKLHYDNEQAQVHKEAWNYLEWQYITIIKHPTNSLDFTSNI